jgi:hypothetical protein
LILLRIKKKPKAEALWAKIQTMPHFMALLAKLGFRLKLNVASMPPVRLATLYTRRRRYASGR